ncbi:MAG: GNAT family N-acetyltransferase [Blautia sp.]|nr:GNAT family N-acetyltransferase [Blautia sp.]MCM1200730.1 GNAT family N-acetyltransferase [Bacteroides fragilis]
MAIEIRAVSWDHADFGLLCGELDAFLNYAIGGEEKREKYKKFNHTDTMDFVAVAYDDEIPAGCGALRRYSAEAAEIKRVFVREAYRGKNIGGMLLESLIARAEGMGFQRLLLETGAFLASSVRLYQRYGFERIENYGAYRDMSESLCMGRDIGKDALIYCIGRRVSAEALKELYASVGWKSGRYAKRLLRSFETTGMVMTAWHGVELAGLVEVLDDEGVTAYVHYLLVNPRYQGKGIGAHLMEAVKERYRDYLYIVLSCENKEVIPFYHKLGFSIIEGSTPMQINRL